MNAVLRSLLLATVFLLPTLARGAGLDPEVDRPYKLDVVLSLGKHRLLTDVFREQIERELSDGLQAGAGELVEVRVVREHPLLKDIERKGLAEAIKDFKGNGHTKTHFVRIDYVEGEYEIQARQHDGLTGMWSPVLRKRRTSDRQFVARTATLFIAQDFGPVATVIDGTQLNDVKVQFKAAGKGKLERWVNKGELLLVTAILPGNKGTRPVADAVLELTEKDPKEENVWHARLFHRYDNPLSPLNVSGYRCLRIATVKTALKLRVVQRDAQQPTPVPRIGVQVRKLDFTTNEGKIEFVTDPEGYLRWPATFERLIFVTVQTTPKAALVPVPLVDDEPVTIRVLVRQDNRSILALRAQLWEQQVNEASAGQTTLFNELQALNKKPELRDKAMDAARKGVEHAEQTLKELGNLRQRLADDAAKSGEKIDLTLGDQFTARLEKGKKELEDYLVAQEKIIKEEIPKQKMRLQRIEDGKLAESVADFEKALAIYEEVLKDGQPDEGLKKQHDYLKAALEPKNDKHKAAKQYIYTTWPDVEVAKLKDALKEAAAALKACREAGDKLTPQKFLLVSVAHAEKLKAQLDGLMPDMREEDVAPAKELSEVATALLALTGQAQKDLQGK